MDRRHFLKASAAQAALIGFPLSGCQTHPGVQGVSDGANAFVHGVASGDPLADRVILWTRASPSTSQQGQPISVDWWIARDAEGQDRVGGGRIEATPERDYTVKIDVAGLAPSSAYYYRFSTVAGSSPLGRTKTLPGQDARHLRFAVASCSNYPEGYFNAYAAIARRDDLDVVLHLGDYLYEYANGEYGDGTELDRIPDPVHEILSLEDYRRRHATYKTDSDSQAAHARHPWITIWDDHESANNSHREGAQNHGPTWLEGRWASRRLAAIRAYYEWMPIRELPTGLFREFDFGGLAQLIMLDTRLVGRDGELARDDHSGASDPDRSLLGPEQEAFFLEALSRAQNRGAVWKIVGQQVIVSPLTTGEGGFNPDTWDGFRASRRRLLDHLTNASIEDVVFLAGDYHSSWAFEVPPPLGSVESYDPETGAGARAIEFVAPAVSSPPIGRSQRGRDAFANVRNELPHLKYLDLDRQGYILLDLTPERVRACWMYTGDSKERSSEEICGEIQECMRGSNRLGRVGAG